MNPNLTTLPGPVYRPVSTNPFLVCGVYNANGMTIADGLMGALQLDVNGNLCVNVKVGGGSSGDKVDQGDKGTILQSWYVQLTDGVAAAALGTSGSPLRIDPTGTTIQPVRDAAAEASLASIVSALTNPLPVSLSSLPSLASGSNTIGKVDILGNGGAALDAATGASVPANAIQVGDRAATALPTAVTGGQLVAPMADKYGRAAVVLNTPRDLVGTAVVSNNSAASAASFIAAAGSGIYTDIITFVATNRSATATIVTLTDGTVSYTFALAANGGIVINFPTPLPASSADTAWTIGNSATVACDYVAVYAKNK